MRRFNVLFLCTGNSARSILGEAIINSIGQGRFAGYSAGSHPRGEVHPLALDLLRQLRLPTEALRSKPWDEFAVAGAPVMDFIFTVCDSAAGEACPAWPGRPMTAHWGLPDPAAVEGSEIERRRAFRQTFAALENRIKLFASLPFDSLDRLALQGRLDAIGRKPPGSAAA
jgi:arsenate reductase